MLRCAGAPLQQADRWRRGGQTRGRRGSDARTVRRGVTSETIVSAPGGGRLLIPAPTRLVRIQYTRLVSIDYSVRAGLVSALIVVNGTIT